MKKDLNNIKNTGFKIPKDYFNDLENQILNNIKTTEGLKDVESTGFAVPDNYFENIEDAVFNKLNTENNTKVISLFNKRNLLYFSGIAASIVLMISLFMNNFETTIDNVDIELVENYIINENLDAYDIAALLSDEDLLEDAFVQSSILDESLENYILENASIEDLIIE